MNKYNEHVKESIDYFSHELECMKHRVCNCDMQTSLRVGREKTAYETAVECLKKQLPRRKNHWKESNNFKIFRV